MTQTVYTNYWQGRYNDIRKEHGSYLTEEEAIDGIKAWWELHKEKHANVNYNRTNSGALELLMGIMIMCIGLRNERFQKSYPLVLIV